MLTPFLPGDSLLFTAGTFAARGSLDLGLLIVTFLTSAILGDAVNYAVGKWLGEPSLAAYLVVKMFILHALLLSEPHICFKCTNEYEHVRLDSRSSICPIMLSCTTCAQGCDAVTPMTKEAKLCQRFTSGHNAKHDMPAKHGRPPHHPTFVTFIDLFFAKQPPICVKSHGYMVMKTSPTGAWQKWCLCTIYIIHLRAE